MSPSLVCHVSIVAQERLNSPALTWRQRLDVLSEMEADIDTRVLAHCNDSNNPWHTNTLFLAGSVRSSIRLLVYRPLHHMPGASRPAPEGFDVLALATKVVRNSLEMGGRSYGPWAWFTWVPWYALAVVLAEICAQPGHPTVAEAWAAAQPAYVQFSNQIADADAGLLWRPIVKLMRKTRGVMMERDREKAANEAVKKEERTKVEVGGPDNMFGIGAYYNSMIPLNQTTDFPAWDPLSAPSTIFPGQNVLGQAMPMDQIFPYQSLSNQGFPNQPTPNHALPPFTESDLVASFNTLGPMTEPTPWMDWDLFLDDVNSQDWMSQDVPKF